MEEIISGLNKFHTEFPKSNAITEPEISGPQLIKMINATDYFSDYSAIIKIIQEGKARVDYVDENKNTPLVYACRKKLTKVALALIDTGLSKPEHQPANSNSALFVACHHGLYEVITELIKDDTVDLVFPNGSTALINFLIYGVNAELNNTILNNVAIKLIETGRSKPEYVTKNENNTALMLACEYN